MKTPNGPYPAAHAAAFFGHVRTTLMVDLDTLIEIERQARNIGES